MIFNLKYLYFLDTVAQWLGLDPDQGLTLFVWNLHVGFPPCPPDSSHSPNTCMFSEARALNFLVCVLAQGWTGGLPSVYAASTL